MSAKPDLTLRGYPDCFPLPARQVAARGALAGSFGVCSSQLFASGCAGHSCRGGGRPLGVVNGQALRQSDPGLQLISPLQLCDLGQVSHFPDSLDTV